MQEKPWSGMDPNSKNQIWSRWTVKCAQPQRTISLEELKSNWGKFCFILFGSAGRAKVECTEHIIIFIVELEGKPVHDPSYRTDVRYRIRNHFLATGLGQMIAQGASIESALLAGDKQDGKPPAQLIVMPNIINPSKVFSHESK